MIKSKWTVVGVLLMILAGAGCARKPLSDLDHPREGKKALSLVAAWKIDDLIGNNPMFNMGVAGGKIYSIRDRADKLALVFSELDGTEASSFIIPKGKGPGEILAPMQTTLSDKYFMIYDIRLLKFSLYSPRGEFLEDVMMDPGQGIPFFHQQNGETFLYSGLLRVKYGEGRIEDGAVTTLRKTEYEDIYKGMEELETRGTRLTIPLVSEGVLFSLTSQGSLRLVRMDEQWNEEKVYADLPGSLISFGIAADRGHLYLPFPADLDKAQRTGKMKTECCVAVFDKESGSHLYTLTGPVPRFDGMLSAVGVTEGKLVLLAINDTGELSQALGSAREAAPGGDHWILVYSLP